MPTTIDVRNPRTGEIDFHIEASDAAEVAAVAKRLRQGQKAWAALGLEGRVAVMRRWAESLQKHRDAIAAADSIDTGGNNTSQIAVAMAVGLINGTCAQAAGLLAQAHRQGSSPLMPHVNFDTLMKPLGLVGVISPWNAPAMLSLLRLIPPLVAGCAVILKPSEVTPRFTVPLRASVAEIPELAAVFEIVNGAGETGAAVVEVSDLINFCGSVPNGRRVAEGCARRLIPCELELGGKDPLLVLDGAEIENAVSATVRGALSGTGQVCFSIERVYVQRPVYDRYLEALKARVAKVEISYPAMKPGALAPFTSPHQSKIVDAHLADAVAKGATIVAGGPSEVLGGGHYMRPTILTGVTHDMDIMRHETFGPVIPIMAFDTIEEGIALANDTEFGLSAAVMAATDEQAREVGAQIDAGNVSLQDAFLTFAAAGAESDSFGASGMGGRRSGILRYMKRQALLLNTARPACITDVAKAA
jgi:acyl-CoA reductase-like NAD-dependent aldehyde dehydrogenase